MQKKNVHALDPPRKINVPPCKTKIVLPLNEFDGWLAEFQGVSALTLVSHECTDQTFIKQCHEAKERMEHEEKAAERLNRQLKSAKTL